MCLQARFTKETQNKCSAPARTPVNRSIFRRLCEFVWIACCVTAPAAWASGPSTLASRGPWGRRCRGTRGLPGRARERWGHRSVHRSVKTASRSRSGAFVYTVATRAASGGTSSSTAMVCRRRPLGGHLPLGRENGLCASAAARLASSPRQQTTQTPEEPSFGHIRTPATSSDVTGSLSRPLLVPSQATSDRSSQHKREAHPGQRLGGPGLPAAPARVRPRRPRQGPAASARGTMEPRLVEEAGPPRAPDPALPPGLCEARLPARRHPRPSRPDRSIMAQRRPSNCGYVTSSHVFRPSGRGAGGARAGTSRPGHPGHGPSPCVSLIYSASPSYDPNTVNRP